MRSVTDNANFVANHVRRGGAWISQRASVFVPYSLSYSSRAHALSILSFFLARSLPSTCSSPLSLTSSHSLSLSLLPSFSLFLSFIHVLSLKKSRLFDELKATVLLSTLPTGSERKTLRVSKGENGSLNLPPLVSKVLSLSQKWKSRL